MTRTERWAELRGMPKARLIRICRAGVRTPAGGLAYIEGGIYPLEQWTKDDLIASILEAEHPSTSATPAGSELAP